MIEGDGLRNCSPTRTPVRASSGIDVGLGVGDVVSVGKTVELLALDTPGQHHEPHLPAVEDGHAGALLRRHAVQRPAAGNCHGGGHPEELYETFVSQLDRLPEDTLIYPGHDYIENNLAFTLDREPDNGGRGGAVRGAFRHPRSGRPDGDHASPGRARDQHLLPALEPRGHREGCGRPSRRWTRTRRRKDVFLRLRELRNSW